MTIVGAGITGITTAYLLANQGLKVVIVDAGQIMNGTTGHTTAKITAQHDLVYQEYLAHFGREKTKLYYDANLEALQFIKQTVKTNHIQCQLSDEDANIYTSSDDYVEKIANEYKVYQDLGIPGRICGSSTAFVFDQGGYCNGESSAV